MTATSKRVAVFLDRDGTINRSIVIDGKPYPPRNLDEFEFLPGAVDAIKRMHDAGYLTVIVTNQPDVARGTQSRDVVEAINDHIRASCPIDDIRVCYETGHGPSTHYKPEPGMLLDAAEALNIDLSKSFMVGDRWRDIGAGKAAGCHTIFIDHKYDEPLRYPPDATVESLAIAAELIIKASTLRGQEDVGIHNLK